MDTEIRRLEKLDRQITDGNQEAPLWVKLSWTAMGLVGIVLFLAVTYGFAGFFLQLFGK